MLPSPPVRPTPRRSIVPLLYAGLLAALPALGGCATLLGARAVSADRGAPTTFHQIAVGDERRTFLLHRPAAAARAALPVLFVLHGTSANANVAMDESGMNEVADSVGALVVYPNGTGGIPYIRLFWNTEHCCDDPPRHGADEAGMVRAIVDTLAHHFAVDRSRIGLIGFSDAGSMAYSLACAEPALLTAIGVISGELPAGTCVPSPAVATIVFHGTADRNVRYGATAQSVAEWARRERCRTAATDALPEIVRARYTGCADGADVVLNTILGGAHAWPGGRTSWLLAPRASRAIDASRTFADFVLSHPRPPQR